MKIYALFNKSCKFLFACIVKTPMQKGLDGMEIWSNSLPQYKERKLAN